MSCPGLPVVVLPAAGPCFDLVAGDQILVVGLVAAVAGIVP